MYSGKPGTGRSLVKCTSRPSIPHLRKAALNRAGASTKYGFGTEAANRSARSYIRRSRDAAILRWLSACKVAERLASCLIVFARFSSRVLHRAFNGELTQMR